MIKLQNASMELLEISDVDSPLVCVHLCKFGTESTCNFIEHDRNTQSCVLAHVPPERYLKTRNWGTYNSNRTFCMETGQRYSMFIETIVDSTNYSSASLVFDADGSIIGSIRN